MKLWKHICDWWQRQWHAFTHAEKDAMIKEMQSMAQEMHCMVDELRDVDALGKTISSARYTSETKRKEGEPFENETSKL